MGTLITSIEQGAVDLEDLFDIFKCQPKVKESPTAKEFKLDKGGQIEFRNVSYGYDREDGSI